jgi:hypothetical protein
MTGGELAGVIVAIAAVMSVTVLAVALWAILDTLRGLRRAVETFENDAVPAMRELRQLVAEAGDDLDRVGGLLDTAERVSGSVEVAAGSMAVVARVAKVSVSSPFVKLAAATRAVAGLRRRGRDEARAERPRLRRVV